MGMQTPSIQQSNQPSGKGGAQLSQMPQPSGGKGAAHSSGTPQSDFTTGNVTTPGQGGQPRMGQPNNYSNTIQPWDNASIQPRQTQSGKGKGY